jgi:hypothetical protein
MSKDCPFEDVRTVLAVEHTVDSREPRVMICVRKHMK